MIAKKIRSIISSDLRQLKVEWSWFCISGQQGPLPAKNSTFALAGCLCLVMISGCAAISRTSPPAPEKARQVITLAKSLEGKPYRFGGTTPQGFDCSGFVQYVFQEAVGIRLPRTSRAQYYRSQPVRLGQEQPSDLLFFDINGRGISHVGIYLGKGLFIHAPKGGGQVKISNANEKYWRRRFRGVHRLL